MLAYLVFCYQGSLWFLRILFHLQSIIDIPLINPQLNCPSGVSCQLICIADPIYIARSHWPSPWSTDVVTDIVILNLLLIYEILHCSCIPQLIDTWWILNDRSLLLFIFYWFALLNPDIFLPPTWSLVCFCCHYSSAIKYSSDSRNFPFHLLSTIDRSLINPQLPWSSVVDCQLIRISDPISIAPTGRVLRIMMAMLDFWY